MPSSSPLRPARKYEFEHPATRSQLTAIGMIVIEGAALESSLEWAIWGLLGLTTDVGQLFTLRQNFEVKVNTFTRVVAKTVKDTTLRKTGADLAKRLRDSSKRRNSVIH